MLMNRIALLAGFAAMLTTPLPALRAESLPRSTPEEQGIASAALLDFVNAADSEIEQMNSLMIVRHGHVIAEGWWTPYKASDPHQLYSLSKSFTSTAVGMAAAEGKLDINDLVLKYFAEDGPKEPSDKLKQMRVRDLLTMSTGHQTEPQLRGSDKPWTQTFLQHPVEHTPGAHFLYNTPATYMQSALVQKVTGQKLIDYLTPRLFEPLGIEHPTWEESPQGISTGGYGLNIRTEDIAKLGQLYLQKGMWNGRQLMQPRWVALATSKQVSNGSNPDNDWNQGYGFQFWRCRNNCYRGDGAFGQYCIVMPDQDAVVAITSGVGDMGKTLSFVWDKLLPAMQANALAPNKADHQSLQEKLNTLSVRKPIGVTPGEHALSMLGKKFQLSSLSGQWESLQLLEIGGNVLVLKQGDSEYRLPCWPDWTRITTPIRLGGPDERAAASCGAWTAPDTFHARICYYETPFLLDIKIKFEGDKVHGTVKQNVGFGNTSPVEFEGVQQQ